MAAQKEARAQQEAAALAGYNSLLDAAKARYDNALAQRQQSYDKAVGDVNGASERAMQQAYLSSELQKRNIGQQLAALGRSGGASETTLLNMANSYGNARGTIDQNRTSQLGALASDLAAGKASDLDMYNNAKAGYDYDYQTKLADLANTSQEKLLGYSNTYANGLAQLEQSKAQQLAQLQSAQNDALMQAQATQARQTASTGSGGGYTSAAANTVTKTNQNVSKDSAGKLGAAATNVVTKLSEPKSKTIAGKIG